MPVERIPLVDLMPDLPGFGARNGAANLRNLLPLDGRLRMIKKLEERASVTASGVLDKPVGALFYPGRGTLFYGSAHLPGAGAPGTAQLFEVALGTTHTITDRSRTSPSGYGGGFYDWSFTLIDDILVASSIENEVQYIDTAASVFADLITSTSKPQAKYACTAKTHLVLANIKDGSTYYPRRVWWSAAGDPQDFDASTITRAGFYEVSSAAGDITGCVGFEDYFLVFTEHKVIRFNWIGGANVWFPQEIAANAGHGMSGLASRSVARVGFDTVYRAHEGFKAISPDGGISSFGLGKIKSIVRDEFGIVSPAIPGTTTSVAVDDTCGLVLAVGSFGLGSQTLGVILVANVEEGRFATMDIGVGLAQLVPFPTNNLILAYAPPDDGADGDGIENMVAIYADGTGEQTVSRFGSDTFAAFAAESRLIEPVPGEVSTVRRVRPAIELEPTPIKPNLPVASIDVAGYSDVWRKQVDAVITVGTDDDTDSDGWLAGGLPLKSNRFVFTLSVAEFDVTQTYPPIDIVGVDVDFDQFSKR